MTSDDGPIIGDVVSVTRDVVQATSVGGLVAKDIVLATGASISITRDAILEAVFGGLVVETAIQTTNVDGLVTRDCFNGGHWRSSNQTSSTNGFSG